MTTPQFNTVLVRDSRLNDITDTIDFSVYQGAGQNTYQSINAETAGPNSIQFSVHPPSESIVIDRHVLIEATVNFKLSITNVDNGSRCFQYGLTDSFQAFPLNKLVKTITAQINNTVVSLNQEDVIDQILTLYPPSVFKEYEGMTPYLRDYKYGRYADAVLARNNPLGGFECNTIDGCAARGSFTVESMTATRLSDNFATFTANGAGQNFEVLISARFIEPLFLSPFLLTKAKGNNLQGFLGVSNLTLSMNLDPKARRAFSRTIFDANGIDVSGVMDVDVTSITNCKLLVNYLSTNALDKVKANNSIPYIDMPRFPTPNLGTLNSLSSAQYSSINIQLSQIPELIIICARKRKTLETYTDPARFLRINNISVNFNNASGLLSSCNARQLWDLSKSNGLDQPFQEWQGVMTTYTTDGATAYSSAATLGSVLVINPAKDLSIPPFLSNGSKGQFNLQYDINVTNQFDVNLDIELETVIVNAGMFSTFAGSSGIYSGLLNKELVLKTGSEPNAISDSTVAEMAGGVISNRVSNGIGRRMRLLGYNKPMDNMRSPAVSSSNNKLDRFL